jgi:hypothetical protein
MRFSATVFSLAFVFSILFLAPDARAQREIKQAERDMTGIWTGTLVAPGQELPLYFHLEKQPDKSYLATMDSPAQNAFGVPVDSAWFENDSLVLVMPPLDAVYNGRWRPVEKKFIGVWTQGGMAFELNLEETDEVPRAPRPQEPTPPYPYAVEEVVFENKEDGVELAGTLVLPDTTGAHPVAILLTGSGGQDRDESIAGHKPFLVIADHLARNGIGTLRFDDRGVGGSTGLQYNTTIDDYAGDALAGVEFLKTKSGVDVEKIGLIGHSEGGWAASRAAARSDDVEFVVLLAAPAVGAEQVLLTQVERMGALNELTAEQIQGNLEFQKGVHALIRAESDPAKLQPKLEQYYRDYIATLSEERVAKIGDVDRFVMREAYNLSSPWFMEFLEYDPVETYRKLDVPVLAILGGKDIQVEIEENAAAYEKAFAGKNDARVERFASVNHLLQTAETGAMSEYGTITETVNPKILGLVAKWIGERTK